MKSRNYSFYGTQEEVERVADEYRFLGRRVEVTKGRVTVLALPPRKKAEDKKDGRPRISRYRQLIGRSHSDI